MCVCLAPVTKYRRSVEMDDVQIFLRACIHRLLALGVEKIIRPFSPTIHGTKLNDIKLFGYTNLGRSNSSDKYFLMLREEHSDYKWFLHFPNTDAKNAANNIINWCAANDTPGGLISDGPTHFKNETVLLPIALKPRHHFTLPYCPWSSGALQRLRRELLRFLRSPSLSCRLTRRNGRISSLPSNWSSKILRHRTVGIYSHSWLS